MPQLFASIDWAELSRINIERTKSIMKENSIDVLVCNGIENIRYLTAFSPFNALAMVKSHIAILPMTAEQPIVYTLPYYLEFVPDAAPWIKDIRAVNGDLPTVISDFIKQGGISKARVTIDSSVNYGEGQMLAEELSKLDCELVISNTIEQARAVKNPLEIQVIKEAAAVAEIGMRAALDSCLEGKREYEVAAEAEYAMRMAGAEAPAFSVIVMSGHNSKICKEISTDKWLRHGDTVLIDQGAFYEGYIAEFARTTFVGKPSQEQKDVYQVIYEAEQACIQALRFGINGASVDQAAREVIRKAGYGQYEHKHATGHGLGVSLWEAPAIAPGSEDVIEVGMVVAVEPSIYKKGVGGIRIEDVILVTKSGPEVLTRTEYLEF